MHEIPYMKNLLFPSFLLLMFACKSSPDQETSTILKGDLTKMKWIEGSWSGLYNEQPFYETYRILNDSMMQIITHDHVGTDSVRNNVKYFEWNSDAYYLGDGSNYKAVHLTDTSLYMIPLKANNEIRWSFVNDSTWTAVLAGANDTLYYTMKRVVLPDSITRIYN